MASTRRHKCSRYASGATCVCPQSNIASRPSLASMKFPGCGSLWKWPCRSSMTPHALNMVSNTPSHPMPTTPPLACRAATNGGHTGCFFFDRARFNTDSSLVPHTRRITMTSAVDSSSTTSGTRMRSDSPCRSNSAANSPIFAASAVKSNSLSMTSRYARKMVGKSMPLSSPRRLSVRVVCSMLRTSPNIVRGSAVRTFTTTFFPLDLSVALCTWAMDAAAMDTGSNSLKCSDSGAPRLRSTMRLMQRKGSGGLLSIVCEKHSKYGSGIICLAVPAICPTLR
mmetsp:Transcript_8715/g.21953  ORF Transcript_8715/g.21953 Transcript_8715/m.21953 type:complete len:282 (-) Transcript_8715:780-1625(-)